MATTPPSTHDAGVVGEEIAVHHLRLLGMKILETNYRFGKSGEIDIVAMDGGTLVFCEVKLRDTDAYGPPQAAITPDKQRKVRRLARAYLFQHNIAQQSCRFDVVCIRKAGPNLEVDYVKDAFQ
jgi:putative endonuclease